MSQPTISNFSRFDVSPYGNQSSGRQILANKETQNMLKELELKSKEPSSTGYHALSIISAVNNLRSSAVPVSSFVRNGAPSTRCVVGAGFEIEYELNMGLSQTDITITDIRVVKQTNDDVTQSAIWDVKIGSQGGRWKVAKEPTFDMTPLSSVSGALDNPVRVGINGFCDGIGHAASILPSHVTKGDPAELDKLKQSGYQLFYVPQAGAVMAGWEFVKNLGSKSPAEGHVEAGRVLASYMSEAHQRGLHVEWTSHRGGSGVLTEAMRCLKQANVDLGGKQRIFLSDHTTSHYEADIERRAIGMDVRNNKWFNSAPGVAQLIGGQTLGAATVACSLTKLTHHTKKDQLAGEAVGTVYDVVVQNKNTVALGAAVGMFGSSPGFALAILGAALASVPSLTEGYHRTPVEPVQQLANKFQRKVS